MITDLTNEAYLSAITVANISPKFLPTSWWQKSSGIDTEQSYVNVTLCIYKGAVKFLIAEFADCSNLSA